MISRHLKYQINYHNFPIIYYFNYHTHDVTIFYLKHCIESIIFKTSSLIVQSNKGLDCGDIL